MSIIPINQTFQSQQQKLVRASVKRAVITNVNVGTRTADVYFTENPQTVIRNIPIASGIAVASISNGMMARVDTFDETNPNNMVISYVMGQASPQATASTAFINLTDVPNSYAGAGGYKVKVKATEDGLEFDPDSGGGGSPGGNANDIQFNDGIGGFAGDDLFQIFDVIVLSPTYNQLLLKMANTYRLNGRVPFGGGSPYTIDIADVPTAGTMIFVEVRASVQASAGIMIAATGATVIRGVFASDGANLTQLDFATDYAFGNSGASFATSGVTLQLVLGGISLQSWIYEVTYQYNSDNPLT